MSTVAPYVQQRDGELFVGDSQVTLQSVIVNRQRGIGPERIQEPFPSLPLVAIYSAITYYQEHQDDLDASFKEAEELFAAHQAAVKAQHSEFFADMRARLAAHRAERGDEWPEPPQG